MSRSRSNSEIAALAVSGAVKRYGSSAALAGMDIDLQRGEWRGLVGPNGAGKTTLMLAITGLIPLDAGTIELVGCRVDGPRPEYLAWVPQEIALYPKLTARENLTCFGRLHGVRGPSLADRVRWALDWTGLEARADDRVEGFSGGMKRRLNIACGVLHRPCVVLLDEPTVGVDPQARERIFAMLNKLREEGAALLQSSHELGDIEMTCDSLTVMDRGKSVAKGTVHDLVRQTVGDHAVLTIEIDDLSSAVPGLQRAGANGNRWTARLDDVVTGLPRMLEEIRGRGGRVVRLDVHRPGLTEVFTDLTGTELRE